MPTVLDAPQPTAPSLAPPTGIGRLVLLGHPVAHSLSPAFQNAALQAAGIPLRYQALDVPPDTLADVLDALVDLRAAGNVTIPHKEAVAARCDVRSALAQRVGAVNTFWCTLDGALCGDNTDVAGVQAAVRALLGAQPVAGLRIALLGAGGSAAARARSRRALVRQLGRGLVAHAPRARIAWSSASRWRRRPGRRPIALADADLVVNATPLGLGEGDELPCAIDRAAGRARRCSISSIAGVRRRGCVPRATPGTAPLDGLTMLVEQGAARVRALVRDGARPRGDVGRDRQVVGGPADGGSAAGSAPRLRLRCGWRAPSAPTR